jgi:hypothetical protein
LARRILINVLRRPLYAVAQLESQLFVSHGMWCFVTDVS